MLPLGMPPTTTGGGLSAVTIAAGLAAVAGPVVLRRVAPVKVAFVAQQFNTPAVGFQLHIIH